MNPAAATKLENQLNEAATQAGRSFHRLVLFVGPTRTGKTPLLRRIAASRDCPMLNVNLLLSQRLLDLPRARRPRQVDKLFSTLIDENPGELLILDNLEVLFDTSLQIDPLRLLKAASRRRTIIAAWNGTLCDDLLTYAEPDHPEYRSYRNVDVIVVPVSNETSVTH